LRARFRLPLRAAAGRRDAKDTEVRSMISSLTDASPEFAALWAEHDVAFRRDDRKRLNHPTLGLRRVGDRVNLEADVLAKYVQRLLTHRLEGA
jgi:hypothetical protein